jgi:hypothetical protein
MYKLGSYIFLPKYECLSAKFNYNKGWPFFDQSAKSSAQDFPGVVKHINMISIRIKCTAHSMRALICAESAFSEHFCTFHFQCISIYLACFLHWGSTVVSNAHQHSSNLTVNWRSQLVDLLHSWLWPFFLTLPAESPQQIGILTLTTIIFLNFNHVSFNARELNPRTFA